jgi:hypothetical protein
VSAATFWKQWTKHDLPTRCVALDAAGLSSAPAKGRRGLNGRPPRSKLAKGSLLGRLCEWRVLGHLLFSLDPEKHSILVSAQSWSQPKAEAPAKLLKIDMAFSP